MVDLDRFSLEELRQLDRINIPDEINRRERERAQKRREQEERELERSKQNFLQELRDDDLETIVNAPTSDGVSSNALENRMFELLHSSPFVSIPRFRGAAADELDRRREQRRREQRQPEEKSEVIVDLPSLIDSVMGR